jgi:hypothetical protein
MDQFAKILSDDVAAALAGEGRQYSSPVSADTASPTQEPHERHVTHSRAAAAVLIALLRHIGDTPTKWRDFYKGKQINVVGYGPGGGYDVYTRLLFATCRATSRAIDHVGAEHAGRRQPTRGKLCRQCRHDGTTLVVMGAPAALGALFGNRMHYSRP